MPKFTEEALTVLKARYLKKDKEGNPLETPEDMIDRVVNIISNAEHLDDRKELWKIEFHGLLDSLKFLPNSPTLMNAGRDLGQLSACFVLPIEDDISAIFEAVKQSAIIHKSGGGTGFSFSRLRPKGSIVKSTSGVASGPISFMKCFDTVTEVIKQGGTRRGANLGVLLDSHPDIYDWTGCKRDKKSFNNFNISVALTDEFMNCVKTGKPFTLVDPSHKRVTIEIDARSLFDYICECAWYCGEPGILFIDTINKTNPTPWLGKIESTNPCVTGDTLILTDRGYKKIADILNSDDIWVNVWNGEEFSEVAVKITGEDKPVLDIDFSDGSSISCTPYHSFYLNDGTKIEAKDLKLGDKLERCKWPIIDKGNDIDEKIAYTAGFYSGDGTEGMPQIYVYGEKNKLLDKMIYKSAVPSDNDRTIVTLDENIKWEKNFVPDVKWSIKTRLTWLSGLIDSDGNVNSYEGSIAITSVNKPFLMKVKRMLNTVGINPTVTFNKEEGYQLMPDGQGGKKEYWNQTCFRLIIPSSAITYLAEKGLKTYRVILTPDTHKAVGRFIYVTKITPCQENAKYVYCFTEPKRHRGIFNGIITGNCGEQPLLPWESCNLGSINISKFIKGKEIDYNNLGKTIDTSVRFLDDVIDVNHYPKVRIARKTKLTRKIGLGVMGWADALLLMNLKYDSPEALEKAEELMKFMKERSHYISHEIAKEKGVFPASNKNKNRNATTNTIAPTGTISMIAGCSSSIEPIFSRSYTKTALDGKVLDLTSPFSDSPAMITAHEISAENHIKMQAVFQKYTDNAVSKTINLPENATVEDVKNAALLAYTLKCKGFTVYREGTRDAPLQITTEAPNGEHKETELRECNSGRCSIV